MSSLPKSGHVDVEAAHRGIAKYAALFEHGVAEHLQRVAPASSTTHTPSTESTRTQPQRAVTAGKSAERTAPVTQTALPSLAEVFDPIERAHVPLNTAVNSLNTLFLLTSVLFRRLILFFLKDIFFPL